MERLGDTIVAALIVGIPLLIAGVVALAVDWLRLRRARLRRERLQLPPSSEPPPPKEPWYSMRPAAQAWRRKRRRLEKQARWQREKERNRKG